MMINSQLNLCQQKELHNMADRNENDNSHKLCKMTEAIK